MSDHDERDEIDDTQESPDFDEDLPLANANLISTSGSAIGKPSGRRRGVGRPNFGVYGPEALAFNNLNQPVGPSAARFTRLVAIFTRQPNALPLHVHDWRTMRKHHSAYIDTLWNRILTRIALTSEQRERLPQIFEKVVALIRKDFQNYKQELRAHYLDCGGVHNNRRYEPPYESIDNTSWRQLVEYWESPTFKKLSENNKRVAAKRTMIRTTGSQSYAQKRFIFAETNNREPDDVEMYNLVYKHKSGKWVSPEAESIDVNVNAKINELPPESQKDPVARNEVFREEISGGKRAIVFGYGMGVKHGEVPGTLARSSRTGDNVHVCKRRLREEIENDLLKKFELREEDLRRQLQKLEDDKKAYETSMNERVNAALLQGMNAGMFNSIQPHFSYGSSQFPINNAHRNMYNATGNHILQSSQPSQPLMSIIAQARQFELSNTED